MYNWVNHLNSGSSFAVQLGCLPAWEPKQQQKDLEFHNKHSLLVSREVAGRCLNSTEIVRVEKNEVDLNHFHFLLIPK